MDFTFLQKLRENLASVTYVRPKKITLFITTKIKRLALGDKSDFSDFFGETLKPYSQTTKIYKPRFLFLYIFGTYFCTKKKGYRRELQPIPIFKVIELYREYLNDNKKVKFLGYRVIFKETYLEPIRKSEDEFNFSESDQIV